MDKLKKFLKSKTIRGILVAVAPVILPLLGVPITPELQALIVSLGGSYGIYGRAVARGPIK